MTGRMALTGTIARGPRQAAVRKRHRLARSMKVDVSQIEPAEVDADLLVGRPLRGRASCPPSSPRRRGAADAKGGFKKLTRSAPRAARRASLVVGLGKREELDAERLRVAAALAAKEAARLEATSLAWVLPESDDDEATAEGIVTGTILGAYRFDRFRSSDPDDPPPPRSSR